MASWIVYLSVVAGWVYIAGVTPPSYRHAETRPQKSPKGTHHPLDPRLLLQGMQNRLRNHLYQISRTWQAATVANGSGDHPK